MTRSTNDQNRLVNSVRAHLSSGLAEMIAIMEGVDVVSFDFFDTLFVRPFVHPEDVFDVLGARYNIPNFRRIRRQAQSEAFQVMKALGRREISVDDIYRCMQLPQPLSAQSIKEAELSIEKYVLKPNRPVVEMLMEALARGKICVITSDMYLSNSFFREMLSRYDLPPVPTFISSDCNDTKRDFGALFDVVAAELGVRHERILHVGDNVESDIGRARAKGLRTYHYLEPRKPTTLEGISPTASLARGLIRLHQEDVPPDTCHELGFTKAGPAALGFLEWILGQARRDSVDRILFVARDGHVLQELAERQRVAGGDAVTPPSSYLLGSRVAFTLAGMTEANFVAHLPFLLSGGEALTVDELLERIGARVPAEDVLRDLGLGADIAPGGPGSDKIAGFLHAWRWEILKICRRNRQGLWHYLRSLGLRTGQRVALVDVGWSGTTQEAFVNALPELMELETIGYYFCLNDNLDCQTRQAKMRMKALVNSGAVGPEMIRALYVNRVAVELFFSAPHPPVIGYTEGPQGVIPVVDPGRRDTGNIDQVTEQIQNGILNFAGCFAPLRDGLGLPPDPLGMAMPLVEFAADGRWKDHELLRTIRDFDAWASTRARVMWLTDYAVCQ